MHVLLLYIRKNNIRENIKNTFFESIFFFEYILKVYPRSEVPKRLKVRIVLKLFNFGDPQNTNYLFIYFVWLCAL